jgi:hypothetical protein
MATNNKATDISDVRPDAGATTSTSQQGSSQILSPMVLPIRGEKRIVPSPVNPATASNDFQMVWAASGQSAPRQFAPTGRTALVQQQDYYLKAAMGPFIDYVYIRLQHRGVGTDKTPTDLPAVYRFLINPNQVAINRTTLDGQAFARAGWQIGVWGEDSLQIQISGKTAGQYWSFGITDRYQQFTESYRNLVMLQTVFENNGYFFEGEAAGEGPLAADWTRRRIKMQEDVELTIGNFVWFGMFESLSITQTADEPWLCSFNMSFIAWKERFRAGSPYQSLIANNVQRGHAYQAWKPTAPTSLQGNPSNTSQQLQNLPPNGTATTLPPYASAVAVTQTQDANRAMVYDPLAQDSSLAPFLNVFDNTPRLSSNTPPVVIPFRPAGGG